MECAVGDVEKNLNHSIDLIEKVGANKVDLICFPESVLDGYACDRPELQECARKLQDNEVKRIGEMAKKVQASILWTLAERNEECIYNSAILFDHKGCIQTVYRKTHLCPEVNEHTSYVRGESLDVTTIADIKTGTMICYDRHFPEVARSLRRQGAELILHPTATKWFAPDPNSLNTAMMRTRAYENRCFILSVNQANYQGGSAFFGPWGEVFSVVGESEEIMYVEFDQQVIKQKPEGAMDLWPNRRPQLYFEK